MFMAIAFPFDQKLPCVLPVLPQWPMFQHLFNFINWNAISINLQWWWRCDSELRLMIWPDKGHMENWMNAIIVRQLQSHSNLAYEFLDSEWPNEFGQKFPCALSLECQIACTEQHLVTHRKFACNVGPVLVRMSLLPLLRLPQVVLDLDDGLLKLRCKEPGCRDSAVSLYGNRS